MSNKQVNGVEHHSQTLNHLRSYELVSDILKVYRENSLGAKSIQLYNNLYKTFAEPLVPYLRAPYSIVAPYVEKADQLGDSTLQWTDDRFPVVKETNLGNLRERIRQLILLPFVLATMLRDYIFQTYHDESKKVGGSGIIDTGKSIVSTELRIAFDAYDKLIEFLGPQAKALDEKARDFIANGQAKADEYAQAGRQKAGELKKAGQQKVDDYKRQADRTANAN